MTIGMRVDDLSSIRTATKILERDWRAEMMRRALAAYYRQGGTLFPCPYRSHVREHRGVHYAYLANSSRTLAVYRIRNERSFSRQAKRWPRAIESANISRLAMANYAEVIYASSVKEIAEAIALH